VDTSLIDCCSKYENPVLLKNLALAEIESYSSSVHIYTDASKISDNKTSAAFYIPCLNVQHGSRTIDHITIFAAELTAIKLALQWAIGNINHDISIFSDSYSSLQTISAGKSNRRQNLLIELEGLASKYNRVLLLSGYQATLASKSGIC